MAEDKEEKIEDLAKDKQAKYTEADQRLFIGNNDGLVSDFEREYVKASEAVEAVFKKNPTPANAAKAEAVNSGFTLHIRETIKDTGLDEEGKARVVDILTEDRIAKMTKYFQNIDKELGDGNGKISKSERSVADSDAGYLAGRTGIMDAKSKYSDADVDAASKIFSDATRQKIEAATKAYNEAANEMDGSKGYTTPVDKGGISK